MEVLWERVQGEINWARKQIPSLATIDLLLTHLRIPNTAWAMTWSSSKWALLLTLVPLEAASLAPSTWCLVAVLQLATKFHYESAIHYHHHAADYTTL